MVLFITFSSLTNFAHHTSVVECRRLSLESLRFAGAGEDALPDNRLPSREHKAVAIIPERLR
jgi:hypothetical protein